MSKPNLKGIKVYRPPRKQADATLSQANPVSDTYYTVLDTTRDVELNSISVTITWGVTQPTDLRVKVTTDGVTTIYTVAAPVSATPYFIGIVAQLSAATQYLTSTWGTTTVSAAKASSGRSVKVEVAVTWGVTQPTPLVSRVKYARW